MMNYIRSLNVTLVPLTSEEKEDLEAHPSSPDEIYEIFKIPGTEKLYMMPTCLKQQAPKSWPARMEKEAEEKAFFYNGTDYINYDAITIGDRPVYMIAPTDESLVGGYQILNLMSVPLISIIEGTYEIVPDGSFIYAGSRK